MVSAAIATANHFARWIGAKVAAMAQQLKYLMGLGFGALTARGICGTIVDNLASAGTSQADALQLTEDINIIVTVAANSGVRLPPVPQPGDEILVSNVGANPLNVYPGVGGSIQGAAVNAPYTLSANASASFTARTGSQNWVVMSSGGSLAPTINPGQLAFNQPANSGLLLLLEDI